MADLPTGIVTFLFTDIEGSTRLWEQDPSGMQDALARHDVALRQAIEARNGHVFKTMGDAFCAVFLRATDAVAAAVQGQQVIQAEPGAIRVRMAMHTGEAELRAGDYFGPPLNRVARILAAGHGGQILLSAATKELIRDRLPVGASLRDLGDRRLRDLNSPVHIFQVVVPDLPVAFPPLNTLRGEPWQTPFGRQVRDALLRIYDLPYLQTHPLARHFRDEPGVKPSAIGQKLQQELRAAIDALRPSAPTGAKGSRIHELLTLRCVEGMDVPDVCNRLGISQSEYYRQYRQGLAFVIDQMKGRCGIDEVEPPRKPPGPPQTEPDSQPHTNAGWADLLRRYAWQILAAVVAIALVVVVGTTVAITRTQPGVLVVTEPAVRPWIEQVLARDARVAPLVTIEGETGRSASEIGRVGISAHGIADPSAVVFARTPYVIAVWEQNRARLGLESEGPVDWHAVRGALVGAAPARFAIPMPGTPLGADGLLLLGLGYYGQNVTSLPAGAAEDAAFRAWLYPFYQRQLWLRSDERVHVDDWAAYRTALADAGLLPEHEALALMPVVEPYSKPHVRYPAVDLWRSFAFSPPPGKPASAGFESIRDLLLSPEAQRLLPRYGLRPVADGPAPDEGPFVTRRAQGVRWELQSLEGVRTDVVERLIETWRADRGIRSTSRTSR